MVEAPKTGEVYLAILNRELSIEANELLREGCEEHILLVVKRMSVRGYSERDWFEPYVPQNAWEDFGTLDDLRAWRRVRPDTLDSFLRANASSHDLARWIGPRANARCVLTEEYGGFGKRLRAEYPHAIAWLVMSAVGFSTDGQQALLYVGAEEGPWSGSGCYFLLETSAGGWQVVDGLDVWIS